LLKAGEWVYSRSHHLLAAVFKFQQPSMGKFDIVGMYCGSFVR